ncbi:glycoside hydrolase family 85 protein [Amanita thiersii Skay4041]|uniref:Glycoside hydrolase family 85 protein n=1 Tax=Amanita thiersii Skay4041 TaxID=703135 RepID=A0A2A9NI24_9AGAR|nr:glycoside hydrolase family 85 protein [Amanita thiersii Skay4041]
MPIAGSIPIGPTHGPLFFRTFADLDAWAADQKNKLEGVLPFIPRNEPSDSSAGNKGKILVCHDYKGGYVESPFSFSYTFNFWSACDTFIYFSHQRVTVPPPGWVNAAHRQGVKMLGVLIFENSDGQDDLLRLFTGPVPPTFTEGEPPSKIIARSAKANITTSQFPFSSHYARVLADLAYQRGFDGYLMNFEWFLFGGAVQARALAAWVSLLREELWKKVGPHAEVVWYDSVTIDGNLSWQDRLNAQNLPYFLSSTGFFSNYTWPTSYPNLMAQYFHSINPTLLTSTIPAPVLPTPSSLHSLTQQDVFVGVDVWGRGTYGGGGFGTHLALEIVSPDSLGMSAAIFAPGWTWETRENDIGRTWEKWWDEEVTLWAGAVPGFNLNKTLQQARWRRGRAVEGKGQSAGLDDTYKAIGEFFLKRIPPDPQVFSFLTNFSPGVGRAWFVEGEKVWNGVSGGTTSSWTDGWEDIEKQTSIGDLVWPVPQVVWNQDAGGSEPAGTILPASSVKMNMADAWNGGTSLALTLSEPASATGASGTRFVWVPIQSLSLTPVVEYVATAVYKSGTIATGVTVEVGIDLKKLVSSDTITMNITRDAPQQVASGWTSLQAHAKVTLSGSSGRPAALALGLTFKITGGTTSGTDLISLSLGQMSVFVAPVSDPDLGWVTTPLWADFTPNLSAKHEKEVEVEAIDNFNGVLTWAALTSLLPDTSPTHQITGSEDPVPAWKETPADGSWIDQYAYWNIYAQVITTPTAMVALTEKPTDAVWIGTSGVEYGGDVGKVGRFMILGKNLPVNAPTGDSSTLRFFVQGVTARGEVTQWDNVVWVDAALSN